MLEAWFFIAAALLILSGGSKLYDPSPTMGALAATGLPRGRWAAYVIGLSEIIAAVAGTVMGGLASLLVAAVYFGFAVFVAYALARRLPLQSCGCFGRTDTPPSPGHLVFNLLSVGAALGVAGTGPAPIDLLESQPLWGLPYLAFVAMGTAVVYLLLAELPRVRRATG